MDTTVLFVMYGDGKGVAFKLQRLIRMKFVCRERCFTDLNYLQGGNAVYFRGKATQSAVVHVTDIMDADKKAESIKLSMRSVFDSVVLVELDNTIGRILPDEEFRQSVESGIRLSDKRLSVDDRLELLLSLRRASKTRYSSAQMTG